MIFEVCSDQIGTNLLAKKYGAKRVELCSALTVGGLTPSYALIEASCKIEGIETHIMIRPREGGFEYNKQEIEIMRRNIRSAVKLGIHGVVFGCLKGKRLDIEANSVLINEAKQHNLEITLHRAIDFTEDLSKSVNQSIELGFDRILTSGGASRAIEGKDQLSKMVAAANSKIEIMAGSGVNASNAEKLAELGVDALHFTSHSNKENIGLDMGVETIPLEEKIKSITQLYKN